MTRRSASLIARRARRRGARHRDRGRARLLRLHARVARRRRRRSPTADRGVGSYAGRRADRRARALLVPGFIDAHVHLESAKLTPAQFARAVVPRGTTAVVCDPHEIANVAGVEGVRWLLDATEGLPLDVFVMAPSCVPASDFESPRGPLGPEDDAGDPAPSAGARRGRDDELPGRHRRRSRRARADGRAARRRARAGRERARAERVRRRRDLHRPRGVHRRRGAGEAPRAACGC